MFWKKESRSTNDWISGFHAGFRTGFDQAFTLVYDQIKKSFNFSSDELKNRLKDEFYAQYELKKKGE